MRFERRTSRGNAPEASLAGNLRKDKFAPADARYSWSPSSEIRIPNWPPSSSYLNGGKTIVPFSIMTLIPLRLLVMIWSSWNHSTTGAGSPPAEQSRRRPLLLENTAELGGWDSQWGGTMGSETERTDRRSTLDLRHNSCGRTEGGQFWGPLEPAPKLEIKENLTCA